MEKYTLRKLAFDNPYLFPNSSKCPAGKKRGGRGTKLILITHVQNAHENLGTPCSV